MHICRIYDYYRQHKLKKNKIKIEFQIYGYFYIFFLLQIKTLTCKTTKKFSEQIICKNTHSYENELKHRFFIEKPCTHFKVRCTYMISKLFGFSTCL